MSSALCHSFSLHSFMPVSVNNSRDRFTVAEWIKHSPATLEVTGSRPPSVVFLRFISRIDTVSSTEEL